MNKLGEDKVKYCLGFSNIQLLSVLLLCLALSSCATNGKFQSQQYTVKSGDTLYFVAWKYRLDPMQLAKWNGLSSPYTIYPGDKILIHPADSILGTPSSEGRREQTANAVNQVIPINPKAPHHQVRKGETLYSISKRYGLTSSDLVRINQIKKPYTIYPGQRLHLKQAKVTNVKPTKITRPTVTQPSQSSSAIRVPMKDPEVWRWPTNGKVIKGFKGSDSIQQGIDIVGQKNQSVMAAASGEVVYSGKGLVNYGKLVIIRHSDKYLSAYAYNSSLLVEEGVKVQAGQAIATMGQIGKQKPFLHFEIRRHGKPVDPVKYLPRKKI